MIRIHSLQHRLILFLLLPAMGILLADGLFSFFYARKVLLTQWQDTAVLRLERAARQIDVRLGRFIELIDMYNRTGLLEDGPVVRRWIIRQLSSIDGVSRVTLVVTVGSAPAAKHTISGRRYGGGPAGDDGVIRFRRGSFSQITPPRYDTDANAETVTLISSLRDDDAREVGRLEVVIRFDSLISDIMALGWWQSLAAGIVNDDGQYLAHTKMIGNKHRRLGENGSAVEAMVRERLGEPSGALLGPGRPPGMVAGFHRMKTAPWTVVMFASGDSVLAPIIEFRNYFFAEWAVFALLLFAVIRLNVARIVTPIKKLSDAAISVSKGHYGAAIETTATDEIGQLVVSYNRMVEGLKERDLIRNTFGRYMDPDVARSMLGQPELLKLGGTKREVVIMMSDIRGFTATADQLPPDGVIGFLNRYFAHMIDIIRDHRGIIVDFVGDGLLVFFEPVGEDIADTACRAIRCARKMQDTLPELNRALTADNLPPLTIGIGVNAGEVVVGNIGSETRVKYGIVGAAVNLTQRIQAEAAAGEIVVSEAVYTHAACRLSLERAFSTRPKGMKQDISLYAINGRPEKTPEDRF